MADHKKITLGILAHVDAGKTTLSEAILFRTGEIRRMGRVDHKDAYLDDSMIERNRGITVFSRQARFNVPRELLNSAYSDSGSSTCSGSGDKRYDDQQPEQNETVEVTLIDTPGHVDFAAEMERALSVIDYALLVVSGSEGVQAHTLTLFRLLRERKIPVLIFVNKMDIAVRSGDGIIAQLRERLSAGVVDFSSALSCSALMNHGKPSAAKVCKASAGIRDMSRDAADEETAVRREMLVDDLTLFSSDLAELVLEREEGAAPAFSCGNGLPVSDSEIAEAVRKCEIIPAVFGSALQSEGIEELLEMIARFTIAPEYGDKQAAQIYKVTNSSGGERLCFLKVTGGVLSTRDRVTVRSAHKERSDADAALSQDSFSAESRNLLSDKSQAYEWETKINQIRLYSGSKYVTAETAPAGTVCAVTGLGQAMPGDAVGCGVPAPDTRIRPYMVYKAEGPADMDPYLVMRDLVKLAEEDPALNVRWITKTREIEIRLMGQVQLEVLGTIIRERFGYDVTFGTGSVLYLETIDKIYEGFGHFEPLRHYAEVHVIIEPGERGSGITVDTVVPEDELARNWQRLITAHIYEKEHIGVLTGSPVTDVKITLAAGRAHDKHTSGGDFREATYRSIRQALMQARSEGHAVLLEPWSEYDIELPAQNVGRAMTDVQQMGGTQDMLEQDGDTARIRGRIPAAEMAGYQQILTGYTAGAGRLSCSPGGYAPCHNAEAVIEASGYDPGRDIDEPADSVFVSHGASDIVRWDIAPERMHVDSVLKKYLASRQGTGTLSSAAAGAGIGSGYAAGNSGSRREYTGGPDRSFDDVREESRRRAAADAELKMIFEKTYGSAKTNIRREARTVRAAGPEISGEQAAENEARNKEIRERLSRRAGSRLRDDKPDMILIDGYNLINADQYMTELSRKDMGAARDHLLERLSNYAGYTGNETIVVFDAYNVTDGEGSDEVILGVRVVFTRTDEPADIRIGKITDDARSRRIYVVSSDMLVQQDSFGHGALRISAREFLETLSDTEEEIRSRLK